MTIPPFDVVIIGAGQAGLPLAFDLAQAGKQVALVERRKLGGSCVNFGCTPTKAAIASAKLAHQARRAAEYGLVVPEVTVDFPAVLARAASLAERSRRNHEASFAGLANPVLLRGHATIAGREGALFRVSVSGREVRCAELVLDTGTRSLIPDLPGISELDYLHAGNWLDRPELPAHLLMLGGGAIGLEMAQFYRRMGSRVTVVEQAERLLGREDADVADALRGFLEAEGIAFRTGERVQRVAREAHGGVVLTLASGEALQGSHLFVATARRPNTDALGLERVGLAPDPRGFLPVNERLETPVPHLWACGDARGGPMFTHTAWDDYRVLRSQLLGDGSRTTARIVPYALFTDPELGRVGLSEAEAREAGLPVRVATFRMAQNGKARELGERRGFIKVVVEAGTEKLLGAAVLAAEGAELVHLYVDLMNAGAPVSAMTEAIHIHPTLAEAAQSALAALPPEPPARAGAVSWAPLTKRKAGA